MKAGNFIVFCAYLWCLLVAFCSQILHEFCKHQTSDDICLNSVQATDQWWHMSELCASIRLVTTYVWTLCKQQISDDICLNSVQASDWWWHMSELCASNRTVMTYVWTLCKQQTSDDICLNSVQATDQWWHMSELALVIKSASEIMLGKRLRDGLQHSDTALKWTELWG